MNRRAFLRAAVAVPITLAAGISVRVAMGGHIARGADLSDQPCTTAWIELPDCATVTWMRLSDGDWVTV